MVALLSQLFRGRVGASSITAMWFVISPVSLRWTASAFMFIKMTFKNILLWHRLSYFFISSECMLNLCITPIFFDPWVLSEIVFQHQTFDTYDGGKYGTLSIGSLLSKTEVKRRRRPTPMCSTHSQQRLQNSAADIKSSCDSQILILRLHFNHASGASWSLT